MSIHNLHDYQDFWNGTLLTKDGKEYVEYLLKAWKNFDLPDKDNNDPSSQMD